MANHIAIPCRDTKVGIICEFYLSILQNMIIITFFLIPGFYFPISIRQQWFG